MIAGLFKNLAKTAQAHKAVWFPERLSGVVTDYHGQETTMDIGWHHVSVDFDHGESAIITLENNSFDPTRIGSRFSGKRISGFNVPNRDIGTDFTLVGTVITEPEETLEPEIYDV